MFGENVPEFDVSLLVINLPKHHIQRLVVEPRDVGFGLISRPRALFLMTLKTRIELVRDWATVYEQITLALRGIHTAPEDCLLADRAALDYL